MVYTFTWICLANVSLRSQSYNFTYIQCSKFFKKKRIRVGYGWVLEHDHIILLFSLAAKR